MRHLVSGALFVLVTVPSVRAVAIDTQKSAEILFWAASNLKMLNADEDLARHMGRAQGPMPPEVDPPCHVCGDTTQTQGEAQVSNWVTQSENPEIAKANELIAIAKKAAEYQALDPNSLTPQAKAALAPFGQDGINQSLGLLGNHLLQKSYDTAQKYDKNAKMAYAGIQFLLKAAKDGIMLRAFGSGGASVQADNESIEYAKTWTQAVLDDINNKVLSGHQYNLCPVYAELARQIQLLGGAEVDMNQFMQTINKLQDELKFDVNTKLDVSVNTADGSHQKVTWTGKAKMTLQLDLGNSCYTPAFDNGGQISVNVTNWDWVVVSKNSDGSTSSTPVTLKSSHSFTGKLEAPQLNLCDPQPLFQIALASISGMPQEVIEAKGQAQKTTLFASYLSAVIATNEVNSSATNAVTGGSPSLPGQAAPSSPSASQTQAMNDAEQVLKAHQNDAAWLMSAQGQAAIAKIQQAALGMMQGKVASAGVVVPQANNFQQLQSSMTSAHLHWTNGQAQPVSQSLHVTKDGATFTLTVTVQQAARQ